jgi:hypothetical protein
MWTGQDFKYRLDLETVCDGIEFGPHMAADLIEEIQACHACGDLPYAVPTPAVVEGTFLA